MGEPKTFHREASEDADGLVQLLRRGESQVGAADYSVDRPSWELGPDLVNGIDEAGRTTAEDQC